MNRSLYFRFLVPSVPKGPLVAISTEEAEKLLLRKLAKDRNHPADALWELARYYQQQKHHDKGLACLRQTLANVPDAEKKASCILGMGQMMEGARDYEAAVRYYREALSLEPVRSDTWYFINNNLGFSLNTLGQFVEGEKYCRNAIEIDPDRPNAFKNLGLARKGQGDYREAGRCFVRATQVNAADARSLKLLQQLLHEHPELEYEFQNDVELCQKAVEVAARKVAELRPTVYRGWRKQAILLWAKLRAVFKA